MDEDLMVIEKRGSESMQGCAPGQCMEADALLELAERGKRSRDYSARMAHVAVCRNCRETFKMLQSVELAKPKPVFGWLVQPRTGFAMVAVAAAALAIFFISQSGAGPTGIKRDAPLAVKNGGAVKPNGVTPKEIVTPPKREEVAQNDNPTIQAPRWETPRKRKSRGGSHKPVTPVREPSLVPEKSMFAESPGILEGEVVYTMVLEGEVTSGSTVEGQVVPKSPPPLEVR
jgi:hypothetical protein